jgi:hypothetical protein
MAHPGLLHLYVHLMEMSAHPEKALARPTRCARWSPTPATCCTCRHIDVLCGDYARVVAGNDAAIAADNRYARTPATSASTSSTARTTTTSAYTARCSAPSGRSR